MIQKVVLWNIVLLLLFHYRHPRPEIYATKKKELKMNFRIRNFKIKTDFYV